MTGPGRLPPGPLPRPVAPFPDETLISYQWRLAAANHLNLDDLLWYLTGRAWSPSRTPHHPTADQLAAVSGRPTRSLQLALPELRQQTAGADHLPVRDRTAPFEVPVDRDACRRCVAARGNIGPVTCWFRHEQNVCLTHRLWIGRGVSRAVEQIDLARLPDVVAAQRRHHRLIRRLGYQRVARAFYDAAYIARRWAEQGRGVPSNVARTVALFDTEFAIYHAGDQVVPLISYPEAVGLASLLASRHWYQIAASPYLFLERHDDPTQFERLRREVERRTGIENYQFRWSRDPLRQWCQSVRCVAYDDWITHGAA